MLTLLTSFAIANPSSWEDTIERVSPSIVSIQVSSNRYFDTERQSSSVATGFIVDAERGIILTNRHVVEPGPVTSQAVLLNSEEISLKPIYRDPIHDFGFYQYDPQDIRFLNVESLDLCLDCAQVGLDVRLIGNDAGEKISILEATLARLDRGAPNYGTGRFNDFNTFYIQAAAGSSGGSSGSPVLNQDGRVVALNAGGRSSAASSFFLPLDRVSRALQLIQEGQPVTRGGLLATFERITYPEAIRLGLSEEEEVAFRKTFPERDGVLVIKQIVPEGPLSTVAEVGDILLAVNGQRVSAFVTLDAILDAHVGETVALRLQRDGRVIEANVRVTDLHSVSPDVLIEGCDAVFNDLSYQVARHYMIPIRGVNIASSGYCFDRSGIFRGNVITAIDEEPVESVVELWRILQGLDDEQAIEVTYFALSEPTRQQRKVVHWDRTWFPLERWQRNDRTGVWDIERAGEMDSTQNEVLYLAPDYSTQQTLLPKKDKWGETVQRALVTVRFAIPIPVQGVYGEAFFGAGVIVDANRGLVAVDRDTVPIALGDLEVIFAGEVRVPAKVVYVHPEHNVTLVQFDPSLIQGAEFTALELVDEPTEGPFFKENEKVQVYGLDYNYVVHGTPDVIEQDQFLQMPMPRTPFFRESNLDVAELSDDKKLVGGVVLNKKGKMLGQWASFPDLSSYEQERSMYVVPAYTIREAMEAFTQQTALRSLGVEFEPLNWIQSTEFGLSAAMLKEFEGSDRPEQWFSVHRIAPSAPASKVLRNGDIILAVEGQRLFHFRHLERLVRQNDAVSLHILRQGSVHEIQVESIALSSLTDTTILKWNGAVIHNVPWFTSMQTGISMDGAYIAKCASGAPCGRDGVWGQRRIVSANQQTVHSVLDLIQILQDPALPDEVRLQVVNLKGHPDTVVLRRDERYWRSELIQWDPIAQSWTRQTLVMDSETSNSN